MNGTADIPDTALEPKDLQQPPFWRQTCGRALILSACALVAFGAGLFIHYYVKFARRIDAKLSAGPFSGTVNIYAAPQQVSVGDALSQEDVVLLLRQAGYSASRENPVGWYNLRTGAVEAFPGPRSHVGQEPAALYFAGEKLARIVSLQDNTERPQYQLAPQLITNVADRNREKRRLVAFHEIPAPLVQAVISAEDKHFFSHSGFDFLRILKAAYVDVKEGRKQQGASTLSMQLVRGLWLDHRKSWRRKAAELLMTMHLEEKLTKPQIFEYYCNQVYLGRRGTFNIIGFGEGARTYFGKDINRLTVPEAATLAGLVQQPSRYNPFRYRERARQRRNVVLERMRHNGYLNAAEYQAAAATPLELAPGLDEGLDLDTQYFVDLANDELQDVLGDQQGRTGQVYTTLDPRLQRAAGEAVRRGMRQIDEVLRKRKQAVPPNQPQVALVALDPRTGEVKALVGGRNYSLSQLNHALSERQPGSVFKPFVYAAALNTAVEGGEHTFTPGSTVHDAPTVFTYGNQVYEPGNFGEFMGDVTLRVALARSLNVATVSLAELVGYGNVLNMARRCGLGGNLRATPAIALGAYEATPLELAGAYTPFANQGMHVKPTLVSGVRARSGNLLYEHTPTTRRALDPRVAYLMTSMMQDVINRGTGAGVRARGFRAPAAGKTGTAHDGWFAGYTTELLAVVWVGFDDNRELGLEGARSALPIWTDFMKRALAYREYRDVGEFPVPNGIAHADICEDSGLLATPLCPATRSEAFIDGSQPVIPCNLHASRQFADRTTQIVPLGNTRP